MPRELAREGRSPTKECLQKEGCSLEQGLARPASYGPIVPQHEGHIMIGCDVTTWPDVLHECGPCKALVGNFATPATAPGGWGSCDAYCADANGAACTGAWAKYDKAWEEACVISKTVPLDCGNTLGHLSTTAICECRGMRLKSAREETNGAHPTFNPKMVPGIFLAIGGLILLVWFARAAWRLLLTPQEAEPTMSEQAMEQAISPAPAPADNNKWELNDAAVAAQAAPAAAPPAAEP